MAQENPQSEDALRAFRLGYDAIAWASLVGMVGLTLWIFYTLIVNTPDGTAASRAYEAVQPTLTAIAGGGGGPAASGPPAFNEGDALAAFEDYGCLGCHTHEGSGDGSLACPPLGAIASTAAERVTASDYTGNAETAEDYIRESIMEPNAYLVSAPGKVYAPANVSLMPVDIAGRIEPAELNNLVAWLLTKE